MMVSSQSVEPHGSIGLTHMIWRRTARCRVVDLDYDDMTDDDFLGHRAL
jgi:hypothetical protein